MTNSMRTEPVFGVFTTDKELRIKVWDSVLARFTGVSAERARGRWIHEIFPEVEARGFLPRLERALTKGTVEILVPAFHRYFLPCPPQTPSRRFDRMLQRTTIAPIHEDTDIVGVIVTIEDVTERIERERELGELLAGADDEARLRAIEEISQSELTEHQLPLIGALSDRNWKVRKTAVEGLTNRAAPEAIAALLDLLREHYRNISVVSSALQVLAMVNIDTFSSLMDFLHDDDPDLRMQAALALGEQREQRAVEPLLNALNDPDTNVRFHVIEALGKLRASAAAEPLTAIAESHDFFLGFPALDALRQIGDSRVVPRLASLLHIDALRECAAETMGELGDETVVFPLVELLNRADAPVAAIANALARLFDRFEEQHGVGSYIEELSRQAIKPTGAQQLLDSLNEVEARDLPAVARVIGWLRGPTVDNVLIRLLAQPDARAEVIEALVKHGAAVTDLLIDQLKSADEETRRACVIALGRLGQKRATMALETVLRSDPALRIEAANALARVGDDAAFDALLEIVGDPDVAVRQAAVGALNSIGSVKMPERVEKLLKDQEPLVRESATRIAGYFGYQNCASLLIDCSRDVDERVRRAAVEHLPFIDDPRVAGELFRAVSEDTPRVRAAAARALGSLDNKQTVPNLLKALTDVDPWVRYFAARSLGQRGDPEIVPALAELVRSEKLHHVRISLLSALGEIGGPTAATIIECYLVDDNEEVARAAATALNKARKCTELSPRPLGASEDRV